MTQESMQQLTIKPRRSQGPWCQKHKIANTLLNCLNCDTKILKNIPLQL